ncbi:MULTISPECIES: D-aminoacyl-tRNA deacylase [unclassified Aureispira]|uniref:D-aminoacyl-tRNA deacylase n=1 Tax=unclassified Aureispira TaxID=2649989 RepID=UPI0006971499|nr:MULTISPECIES: D-aminoacyl-tRNA deacylase [unclassified Aureispira]WMX15168.1 D-aminoacyl-tRNA deacylase [Aureispira sp. CCB-E]
MRIILQRVKEASVTIEEKINAQIGQGLLLLLGIEQEDGQEDIDWLSKKVLDMRIFSDEEGKMNRSISDLNGDILVVSQFTLHANIKKGTRPSFIKAARPEIAIPLYENFVTTIEKKLGKTVATGVFGADMQVALVNDGPVTIIMDSKNKNY